MGLVYPAIQRRCTDDEECIGASESKSKIGKSSTE